MVGAAATDAAAGSVGPAAPEGQPEVQVHSEAETSTRPAPAGSPGMTQVLLGEEPLTRVLERVAHAAADALPGGFEVSVTLVEDQRPRSVVFTGDLAVHLDERQYEDSFGPCLDAARTGRTIALPDMAHEESYPDFARQAARQGVTRSLSVGLPVPGRTVGGLNLYGRDRTGFDEATVAAAEAYAGQVSVVLANAALYARAAEQVQQMREAMASRSVIEQAKGMLMAARRIGADEAFSELSRMAARSNRKVRALAEEIVERKGEGL